MTPLMGQPGETFVLMAKKKGRVFCGLFGNFAARIGVEIFTSA
jgi:hypothetical protein